MSNLVVKVEALLLHESFDTLCRTSVVYLTIEDNILPSYDKVKSKYISICGLKALKALNMDREIPLDHTQKEIEENFNILKSKLEYKSREIAMIRSLEESGKKVTQLSDSIAFFKSIISDTRKAIASAKKSIDLLENKCWHLKDIISAKDRKIITLVNQILSKMKYSDVIIELETYPSTYERKLWVKRHSESEHDLETRKNSTH
ncbi:hypothetical protein C1645_840105 [Glomus cerebriforme]|uniref:Uncharacterized protein n=1 Tax=Glomus cerebriforme TaxID=658196 RepID=A0A397RZV0_9GLOM|nr:hypothetical protein C1645_840105 [Glomus cerebriforme]